MAKYVNQHLLKYIPEKDIQDSIMEENPVPDNILQGKPLDTFLKELLDRIILVLVRKKLGFYPPRKNLSVRWLMVLGPLSKVSGSDL